MDVFTHKEEAFKATNLISALLFISPCSIIFLFTHLPQQFDCLSNPYPALLLRRAPPNITASKFPTSPVKSRPLHYHAATQPTTVSEVIVPISPEQAGINVSLPGSRTTTLLRSPRAPRALVYDASRRNMVQRESPRNERYTNGNGNGHANGHHGHVQSIGRSPVANGHSPLANGHMSPLRSPSLATSPPLNFSPMVHFARLREELADVASRDEKLSRIAKFISSLPKYYSDAAKHFITAQRRAGLAVNIDTLAEHFSLLDQTAASVPVLKRKISLASPSASPITLPSPISPSARHETSHDLKGFAPSRPHVANLLSPNREEDDKDEVVGGKQELR